MLRCPNRLLWVLAGSVLALVPVGPASAGETPPGAPPAASAVCCPPKPKGLVPVPDYTGALCARPFLTGDWGGCRTRLAQRGLTVDLTFADVLQGVVDGGRDTGWANGSRLEAYFTLDLQRMGVLPGALITMRAESRFGSSVNREAATLLPVNDVAFFPLTDELDEDVPIALTELRYAQFLSPQFGFFLGKYTTLGGDANEFAAGRGDTQFLSHPFLSASVTALMNPYSTLGAGVLVNPSPCLTITSALYAATDSSTTTGFDTLDDGLVWSTSVRGQYRLGSLPGGMMATFQYAFDNDFADFHGKFISPDGVRLPRTSDSWNVFWNGWQYLYVERPSDKLVNVTDGRTDLQGLGIFARAATADADTNPVEWVASGGVAGKGIVPGRDLDTFGVGYARGRVKDAPFVTGLLLERFSSRFEAYYSLALTPAAELAFDAQWADSVLATEDPAWLLGLRLRLRL